MSATGSGPWTQVLDKQLEDSRQQLDPLPLQIIDIDTEFTAQFVKFELVSWWGKSGGLQYFDIQRGNKSIFLFVSFSLNSSFFFRFSMVPIRYPGQKLLGYPRLHCQWKNLSEMVRTIPTWTWPTPSRKA